MSHNLLKYSHGLPGFAAQAPSACQPERKTVTAFVYRGRTLSLSLPPFTKAVKWLIIINAAVYLLITILQVFAPDLGYEAVHLLGLVPYLVTHGAIWQLITYSFVH